LRDAGLTQLCLWLEGPTLPETLALLERFATEVKPKVG
jgi:hypothetical protein